jgi:hypothetical protein
LGTPLLSKEGHFVGVWGMGLSQSDEFLDIYDRFFEEYDGGKEPADISDGIVKEYLAEFDKDDGVLHDVYFALAKAQWECCAIQKNVYDMVKDIVENEKNIKYYLELGATGSDIKERRKVLRAFLDKLSVPREKARKRKKPRVPKAPALSKGDIFAYPYADGYGGGIALEHLRFYEGDDGLILIALSDIHFSAIPSEKEILDSYPYTIMWFEPKQLPAKKTLIPIGKLDIKNSFNGFAGVNIKPDGGIEASNFGDKLAFELKEGYRERMNKHHIPMKRIRDYITIT